LERIWNPKALVADIGDALVLVPIIRLGQSLVDHIVKVLVVRKDDMAANVKQLSK
jgi:hypothetical protein